MVFSMNKLLIFFQPSLSKNNNNVNIKINSCSTIDHITPVPIYTVRFIPCETCAFLMILVLGDVSQAAHKKRDGKDRVLRLNCCLRVIHHRKCMCVYLCLCLCGCLEVGNSMLRGDYTVRLIGKTLLRLHTTFKGRIIQVGTSFWWGRMGKIVKQAKNLIKQTFGR